MIITEENEMNVQPVDEKPIEKMREIDEELRKILEGRTARYGLT